MFLWRHFPNMVAIASWKNSSKTKLLIKSLNEQCLHRLIQLTNKLNFNSSQLKRLIAQNSNVKMISTFLQQVRPIKYYFIFIDISISFVTQICNILQDIISKKVFKIINIKFTLNEEFVTKYQCERLYKDFYLSIKS
jgi:hypothetical protein